MRSSDNHIRTSPHETPQESVTKIRLKISYLKFHLNLPGANEFSSPTHHMHHWAKKNELFIIGKWLFLNNMDIINRENESCWKVLLMVCYHVNHFNTLRPRQDGHCFPDDTLERIFLKENVIILIKNSLKFVPKGPINDIPTLVQIMAGRRPGDKPWLPTHMCVTRPQRVKLKSNVHTYISFKICTLCHAEKLVYCSFWPLGN